MQFVLNVSFQFLISRMLHFILERKQVALVMGTNWKGRNRSLTVQTINVHVFQTEFQTFHSGSIKH